jgi:Ca2+-binding RTX toxin-like protein
VDTLVGGLGDDTYYMADTDDVLVENSAEGQDTVIAALDFTLSANIENLRLAEGSAAITGAGNELDNCIEGNSQNNTLSGLAGADTLIGNAGNDVLDGGVGVDTMIGGEGKDVLLVGGADDYYWRLAA